MLSRVTNESILYRTWFPAFLNEYFVSKINILLKVLDHVYKIQSVVNTINNRIRILNQLVGIIEKI